MNNSKTGRNDPCLCGSGKKYKRCCLPRDEFEQLQHAVSNRNEAGERGFIAEMLPEVDAAVDRALEQAQRGAGARVEAEIKSLLEKYPRYHSTNFAMGVYLAMVEKKPADAIPFFQAAVDQFPPFAEAHFNLGAAAQQIARVPTAVAAFRAAERYSCEGDGIAEMAREQLRLLERILLQSSSFKSLDAYVANAELFDRAFQALQDRQFQQAVDQFERVLSENPDHVQSYGNLGLAHAGLGRRAAALACLDRALALDPDYEPARQNRGVVALMQDGVPFLPDGIKEIDFYADKVRP